MDQRDHPPFDRSRCAAGVVRDRFEWTRTPGLGPSLTILGDLSGKRIAELGCGGGHNLAYLVTQHGARGLGIDHDAAKIQRARRTYPGIDGLAFHEAEACAFLRSQPRASLDLCLSIFGAVSFTEDLPALLTATAHALRPGGLFGITLRQSDTTDLVLTLQRR